MRVPQVVAATTAAVLVLTATTTPADAAAARPKCAVPIVAKVFDHDQTGGWWAITVDMHCDNYKYTKEFVLSVYNRRTREPYFFQTLPTTVSRYHKVVTVPSTPPSAKESACVDASAAIFGPNEDPLNSERTYDCFPTASPA
ncbi:hypothetical protein [Kribbella speibonae]|uniref:Secreted protein n=1 Tax=Kribbella speibonae TaxID=1572660 RepID=A0ABY2A3P3_9ACTN|nr:hypothetical protein [Kribbella speibonae]TCC22136.1 hypothetical protein E0H58_25065 [Kribbella speibonae]